MRLADDEYGAVAPIYDAATAWALDPLRRELGEAVGRERAVKVLDVCCGTGRQCLFYAKTGRDAVGLDLSWGMIRRAARLENIHAARMAFLRGDACRLPFPDASFIVSTIALALHEKPPGMRPLILAEMLRVTAPGGLIGVVDYLSPKTGAQSALSWGVKAVERLAGRDHHAHYADYMRQGGLEGLLERQGMRMFDVRRRMFGLIGIALIRRPA
ncbi:MAG: type 11 [Desulfovibrionaceae bacterium]|nr:MAG: type 11 [Desulfovibrionaceae bacterium]